MDSISYKFNNENVTVSYRNQRVLYLNNYSGRDITMRNDLKLTAEDLPPANAKMQEDLSAFYLHFDCGDDASDLVAAKDIDLITMSLGDDCKWSITKIASGDNIYWCLFPPETMVMKNNTGIAITISQIDCNPFRGMANLHIRRLDDDSRYQCPLIKVAQPVIKYFLGPSVEYNVDDDITLRWEVDDFGDGCKVTLNGRAVNPIDSIKAKAKVGGQYLLEVVNPADYTVDQAYEMTFQYILSYQLEKARAGTTGLILSWDTKNTDARWIDRFTNLDAAGSLVYPYPNQPHTDITLFVKKKGVVDTTYQCIGYDMPVVNSFTARHSSRQVIQNSRCYTLMAGLEEDDFIPVTMVNRMTSTPIVGSVYGGDDPPEPHVVTINGIEMEWNVTGAAYITTSLQGAEVHYSLTGKVFVDYATQNEVILYAFDNYGYYVQRTVSVT
ncbi:hypothetical protein H0486_11970 [Lachnospiraceae bacterium MD1]|uniref:Uncharacterized protein n=1 Tax=Variimorphobacter saccharofermentans TaxID=2755051 RepID=A0A839K324_9FIRM|nr:hypothetical protein [Variimorphobacter saccharofermentans]MBB2183592.1 hypothetical protein [Variimorphobacter saccharofermentans]